MNTKNILIIAILSLLGYLGYKKYLKPAPVNQYGGKKSDDGNELDDVSYDSNQQNGPFRPDNGVISTSNSQNNMDPYDPAAFTENPL